MNRYWSKYARSVRRGPLIAGMTVLASLAGLAGSSPALAKPTGPYAVFSDCPLKTPGDILCVYGQTTGGEFTIGSTTVPINKTITLQAGGIPTGAENEYDLAPAADGNSLSKTELNVPGGLLDLINCKEISNFFERIACEAVFESKATGVTATTELVASASNPAVLNLTKLFTGEIAALVLPVRVHLSNPLLGGGCYVGSQASPVQLHLITGTTSPPPPNKPISGKLGTIGGEEEVLVLRENSLVDNSFSTPAAEGCGGLFSFLIDPIVDAKLGLPSKAGHNTAVLNGTLKAASAEAVLNSEKG